MNTMNQSDQALQWAMQYITLNKKLEIVAYHQVTETSYSIVHKIETTDGIMYLKQTPAALFLEPIILDFLNKHGCINIPKLIAKNNDLCCFLMTTVGDHSLRQLFNGQVQLAKLIQGILNFTNMQRLLEHKISEMLALGIPDWRLHSFPFLYHQLIQQDQFLIEDGLTEKECEKLYQLYPACVNLCESLSAYRIPETINHCDFHENNMLLDNKTAEIGIIDWGEVVITHPFFSLNGCLWNVTFFNNLKKTDKDFKKLQSQCVSAWLNIYKAEILINALSIADKLSGIFAALSYQLMYEATKNLPKNVQQEHPGSIAGCLRSFIMANS